MNRSKPALAVLCAGVAWGVISLFVRALSAAGLRPLQISLIRMVTSTVCFFPLMALRDPAKLRIRLRDLWMFVGTGIVSVVLFNSLYFYTTVQSALVGGIFGASYRLTGRVLLAWLGSGFFYALYTIFARLALRRYDSTTVTAYTFLLGALGSLPLGKAADTASTVAGTPILLLFCLGIGVISTVLPYVLYTWGLQRMDSGRAAILVAVEPLVGAVLGMVCYGEPHDLPKLAGIALILAAILLLNRREKEK